MRDLPDDLCQSGRRGVNCQPWDARYATAEFLDIPVSESQKRYTERLTYAGDDRLANRNADSTTERPDEDEGGSTCCHIFEWHGGLQANQRSL